MRQRLLKTIPLIILVLAIILAIQILNIGGTLGNYLINVASYLPRLLGGIVIIVIGTVLVDFLATLVGKTMKLTFPEATLKGQEFLFAVFCSAYDHQKALSLFHTHVAVDAIGPYINVPLMGKIPLLPLFKFLFPDNLQTADRGGR